MEGECPECGFLNPEGAGFCSLCGIPFIGSGRHADPSARPPSRVKGESRDIGPRDLMRELDDEDDPISRSHSQLIDEVEKVAGPTGKKDAFDELDSVLSDYDGMGRTVAPPPAPPAPEPTPETRPTPETKPAPRPAAPVAPGSRGPTPGGRGNPGKS